MSDSATPWTEAYQAPPSMGFSRQEYWSGVPLPSGELLDPGTEPESPALAGRYFYRLATIYVCKYIFKGSEELSNSTVVTWGRRYRWEKGWEPGLEGAEGSLAYP